MKPTARILVITLHENILRCQRLRFKVAHLHYILKRANLCVCRCMCHCLYLCLCICLCICACLIVGYHFRWKDLALSTPTSQGGKYLHWWHIWWHIYNAISTQHLTSLPGNLPRLFLPSLVFLWKREMPTSSTFATLAPLAFNIFWLWLNIYLGPRSRLWVLANVTHLLHAETKLMCCTQLRL